MRTKKKGIAIGSAVVFLSLGLAGCGGSGSPNTDPAPNPILDDPPSDPIDNKPPIDNTPAPPDPADPIVSGISFEQVPMPTAGLASLYKVPYAPAGVIFAMTREEAFGDGADGVWVSFDDGSSWTKTLDGGAAFISVLSGDANWVIAGGGNFYAVSSDGGATWTVGDMIHPIFETPLSFSDASGHTPESGIFLTRDIMLPGLSRSLDQGASWTQVFSSADVDRTAEAMLQHIEVSPSNPTVLYASTGFDFGIWKSVNSGNEFFSIKTGVSIVPFVFASGIVINPRNSDQLFIKNNISVNGGANWSRADITPSDTFWYRDKLLRLGPGEQFESKLFISHDSGASWQEIADVLFPPFLQTPGNIWKTQDALFIEKGSFYKISLSEIDGLLGD